MSPRLVWLAAALAAPLLVAGLALLVSGREHDPDDATTESAGPSSRDIDNEPAASPSGPGDLRPDRATGHREAKARQHQPEAGPRPPLSTEELWADIADPRNSDLPHDVFHAAADVATAVVIADTTGKGRERWPDYWRGHRSQPCCRAVTVHAASARSHAEHPGDLKATVVWTGQPNPHAPGIYAERITQLRLTLGPHGGWRPARSASTRGAPAHRDRPTRPKVGRPPSTRGQL